MFGFRKNSAPTEANSSTEASTSAKPSTRAEKLTTKQRGQIGEDAAVLFLKQNDYQIIERNWRPGNALRGEIDVIAGILDARGHRVLCFVEVKARSASLSSLREIAAPQEAVTISKQRQIARLANAYVSIHHLDEISCRFDVVEVHLTREAAPRCTLCVNAFDYPHERGFEH